MAEFIDLMNGLPHGLLYVLLALGAAVENIVPAVPADTFVALGGFLAGVGDLDARWVVFGAWTCNVLGAMGVYRASHLYGPRFFERGAGRFLLLPHQFDRVRRFYDHWGVWAIFFSRFVPGVRAVVPVFAGATHQPTRRVLIPIALASGIWYSGLVLLALAAGQNLDRLARALDGMNTTLGLTAVVVFGVVAVWWILSRRSRHEP